MVLGYSQDRPKHKNAIRHFQGTTIFAKHNTRPGLKLVKNSEGVFWIKLKKSFFNIENDIFFVVLTFHQKNATQNILSKTDYFGSLVNSIFKYKD